MQIFQNRAIFPNTILRSSGYSPATCLKPTSNPVIPSRQSGRNQVFVKSGQHSRFSDSLKCMLASRISVFLLAVLSPSNADSFRFFRAGKHFSDAGDLLIKQFFETMHHFPFHVFSPSSSLSYSGDRQNICLFPIKTDRFPGGYETCSKNCFLTLPNSCIHFPHHLMGKPACICLPLGINTG